MAAPGSPVTEDERQRVAELHGQGLARNRIAREIGRSTYTVTKIAKELGLSFERGPGVIAATAAVVADARARRAALAIRLLDDVERLRSQLFAECVIRNFGGKDNTYAERKVDRPPFRDQQAIAAAVGLLIDRAVRLDAYDAAAGSLSEVDVWLAAMGA